MKLRDMPANPFSIEYGSITVRKSIEFLTKRGAYIPNFELYIWIFSASFQHQKQPNRTMNRLRMRKGRSVVHKNLEDNYGAVVVANHEALAQVLEQVRPFLSIGFSFLYGLIGTIIYEECRAVAAVQNFICVRGEIFHCPKRMLMTFSVFKWFKCTFLTMTIGQFMSCQLTWAKL